MTDPTLPIVMSAFGVGVGVFLSGCFWRETWRRSDSSGVGERGTGTLPPPVPLALRGSGVSPGPYGRVDLLVVGLVLLLFGFLAWSNLQVGDVKPQQIRPVGLVVSMLMQGMIAGMLVMCVWVRYPLVEWLGLRWPKWRSVFWQTPLALFAVWALMIAVSLSGYLDWLTGLGVETSQDSVRLLKESDDPAVLALMAVAAVLVAPVCEEVVFRGYLYPAMKHHSGPVCAAMVSALVFSAAHGSLAAILPLFILGLVFVWLYEKSGSIWAPIALHFAFNSATVLLQFLIRWLHLPIQTP